jgi:hypothetical protein
VEYADLYLAPRDGFAIDEKTSRILGVFDVSSLEIPQKHPYYNVAACGGCQMTIRVNPLTITGAPRHSLARPVSVLKG